MKKVLLFSLNLILIIEAFERGFPGGNLHPGLEGRGSGSQEDANSSRVIPYIQLNFLINLLQLWGRTSLTYLVSQLPIGLLLLCVNVETREVYAPPITLRVFFAPELLGARGKKKFKFFFKKRKINNFEAFHLILVKKNRRYREHRKRSGYRKKPRNDWQEKNRWESVICKQSLSCTRTLLVGRGRG